MRESEIHFSRWIFESKSKNWLNNILVSIAAHLFIFFLLTLIKPKTEIVADQASSTIKIDISELKENKFLTQKKDQKFSKKEETKKEILTDAKKNSSSHFEAPSVPMPKASLKEKKEIVQNDMSSFLPSMNNADEYWHKKKLNQNSEIVNDGDIPIEGPSLAPRNEPKVIARYDEKDLSLFQFTQQFKERFGAVWNSEERMVPPTSPLHPGDIVYYKIFINSNGKLEKFENLTQKEHPQKDYSDVDKLFQEVIARVFPMSVPPKFAKKNITLTETIAIQVVDKTMPARFSF